jgi:hypothetical protein
MNLRRLAIMAATVALLNSCRSTRGDFGLQKWGAVSPAPAAPGKPFRSVAAAPDPARTAASAVVVRL